jgi:DNA modification methylase
MTNHLYYGDNLTVLRDRTRFPDAFVDLIYLDPPFNSNADYNALFKTPKGEQSAAQMEAFTDTWVWDDASSGQAVDDVKRSQFQDAAKMLDAMVGFLGKNALTAYLAMMAVRLIELHRVLKPTGSLYLHCDPTASHYLKILLDAVFGADNFLSEVIWKRTSSANNPKRWGPVHDTILLYSASPKYRWNKIYEVGGENLLKSHDFLRDDEGNLFRARDLTGAGLRTGDSGKPWRDFDPTQNGRHWAISRDTITTNFPGLDATTLSSQQKLDLLQEKGLIYVPIPKSKTQMPMPRLKLPVDGRIPARDVVTDIPPLNSQAQERLGYPTQKPVALLERILSASSNPGDVVLDPFCGCGTTVHAAQKLGRQWIGIDITHLAIGLIEKRLNDAFEGLHYTVHGTPMDTDAARDLFSRDDKSKKQFETWAVLRIGFIPQEKKGADGGLDGVEWFGPKKEYKAIVSVKGGKTVGVDMLRSLDAVITQQGAAVGVFLTLEPPTSKMVEWAKQAGMFEAPGFAPVPRIQIVTIEQAIQSRARAVNLPARHNDTFKRAAREEVTGRQSALDL